MEIDGREVEFKASAAVPRIYRMKFRRDLFVDLQKIAKSVKKKGKKRIRSQARFRLRTWKCLKISRMSWHSTRIRRMCRRTLWTGWSSSTHSIYQILPAILELWNMNEETKSQAKKLRPSSRELNTPLFLLRCCQVGISIRDLDLLTVGMVMDMFTEQQNDSYKYPKMATQEDFDKF